MTKTQDSADRAEARRAYAVQYVMQEYATDDIDIPDLPRVDYVDCGYWVEARLFVPADETEEPSTA